jgi:hypothetical protein
VKARRPLPVLLLCAGLAAGCGGGHHGHRGHGDPPRPGAVWVGEGDTHDFDGMDLHVFDTGGTAEIDVTVPSAGVVREGHTFSEGQTRTLYGRAITTVTVADHGVWLLVRRNPR